MIVDTFALRAFYKKKTTVKMTVTFARQTRLKKKLIPRSSDT